MGFFNKKLFLALLYIALISLSACARSIKKHFVEPAMAPIVDEFLADGELRGRSLNIDEIVIEFGDTQWPIVGYCSTLVRRGGDLLNPWYYSVPHIVIDRHFWATKSSDIRKEVLYHELGHCLLGLHHTSIMNADNMPGSIMNPYVFDGVYFHAHETSYIDQLFGLIPIAN